MCRQEGRAPPQDPSQEVFLAFGRVFSGVLKDGQSVHVLSAAYNPAQPHLQRQIHQVRKDKLDLSYSRQLVTWPFSHYTIGHMAFQINQMVTWPFTRPAAGDMAFRLIGN